MTTIRKNLIKSVLVHVGSGLAIFVLGIFMYAMQQGGLQGTALRLRQVAQLASFSVTEVDLVPMPYDVPTCALGTPPANAMIVLSKPDAAAVYISKDGGLATPAMVNVPIYLEKGNYRLIAQTRAGYAWSSRSLFGFSIDKVCDNSVLSPTVSDVTATTENTVSTTTQTVNTATTTQTSTTGDATMGVTAPTLTTQTTTTTTNVVVQSTAVIDTDFSLGKNYPTDWSILPMIFKDNVRVFDASGQVVFQVEVPSDRAVLLVGTPNGLTTNSVYGIDRGLMRIYGTQRWTLPFDSRKLADGSYRIAAAYFTKDAGWKFTGSVDFRVNNTQVVAQPVPATTTVTSTGEESNLPQTKPTQSPVTVPSAADFTPTLRLVVDDHQITSLGHVFDRELLEIRATTLPAQSVQFLALSLDGAFKPAIKELGKGGRDELLSRDGKEVWTYSVDMGEFPTGNYRLFARIHTLDDKLIETAPNTISVQHLNQLATSPNPSLASSEVPPATATREQILQRVQDPSSCQNRQECQVFCSSSSATQEKCADFSRVQGAADYNTQSIQTDVSTLQNEVRDRFAAKLGEFVARASFIGATTTVATTTATTSPESSVQFAPYVGRPSLADVLPAQVLDAMVANPKKIAAELPADVRTPSDFQSYCGVVEHAVRCTKIITNIAPDLAPVLKQQEEIVQRVEQQATQIIEQRTGARVFTDTDGDGISDYDEINIFHTDPNKRDTFNSGYSDGAVLLSQSSIDGGVNSATGSSIMLGGGLAVENPKITGSTQPNVMNVSSVAALELKDVAGGKKDIAKTVFKGKALPNSFVKVYLFSDPIVVTVKTDDQGNWSYILDKTLPDGAHTAYVAMVDNGGRILAKSAPLPFIKEASALTVEAAGPEIAPPAKTGMFSGLTPFALMALIVGVLGLGLSVIGAVIGIRHSAKQDGSGGQPNII